jgi:hypothetical protein
VPRSLYHRGYIYVGGHPDVPKPYFGGLMHGEVRVSEEAIEYWTGIWPFAFTFKKYLSIPVSAARGVRAELSQNSNLSTNMYGRDWLITIQMTRDDQVYDVTFRTRPLWAPNREKNTRTFEATVAGLM